MLKVTFIQPDGSEQGVETDSGLTLMESAKMNDIPGIEAECGGACACATCHVYVDEAWTEIVGKPSPFTVDYLRERIGLPLGECLMVGDRLETDIRMASDAGMASALVLTGATSEAEASRSATQPTYTLRNLREVLPAQYRY